jgi:tape measure domain-containing protein
MEFDNAAFERNLKTTLTSLAQLDKALKLTGAQKGLTDVAAAAKRVDMAPLSTAVQSVSTGFLTLSTIAVTALSTITHAAITSGSQIVKSLSLDPILDGFREYELNIGSIQTILANTRADGTGLGEVNEALDTLNEYSDKTIYNFGQMTRNIGTFTAAGVDLDTAVQSIKGISNLAAISGSSAEQAATAMYQLSQAVSTGTLRLMDWNSVVNAGMGGEVFQKALFETGVAMGTITDAPVGTTFEEWTAAGNSFRDSLQEGWLTGEVLTNTLAGFTGELTEAQLLGIGYTKEQAAEILELGQTGVEAATRIRTLSQLLNTVKETVASGWSQSFRTVFGNFEEASDLFTNVNNAITGFVEHQAEARNQLLEGWKELGGRDLLIRALGDAFKALREVIAPIREAFRDIFPPATAQRLFEITESFAEFTRSLRPSETTIENIKRIFTGLFSALDIGWTIIKEGVGFIKDLVLQITGLGEGNIVEFTADIFDFFTRLREGLDQGAAIERFFDDMSTSIQGPIQYIKDLKDAIFDFFDGFDTDKLDEVGEATSRFGQRFSTLRTIFDRITSLSEPLSNFFDGLFDILDKAAEAIGEWFSELGQKLADAIGPGEFDAVLDALNVSLLGGIALLISKFLSGGINLDFGGGMFENISGAFEQLTGVLNAMQTSIRADALLKIAGAVGILTASVVALSLVDSEALTRALVAMGVGFAQLMASFAVINSMNVGLLSGGTFTAIAAGMILLSTAVLILSGAVALLSRMSWDELTRGLTALGILLAALVTSAIILSKNAGSILLASVSLIAMSTAINLLAGAVALFATMQWDTLVRGFAGVTAGLLILAGAMHLMPSDLAVRGIGLIFIATALNILAGAVALFATMEWDTLVKGFAGIAAGLLIIAAAMHLMPPNMLLTAAGLVVVGVALNILAQALRAMGGMSWEDIGQSLVVLAGALTILTIAVNAMSGALAGAAAMLIVSAALAVLAGVLIALSAVPFDELVKAIGAIAIALAVFGLAAVLLNASGATASLIALGAAMFLLGAAFALFGVGALAVAKAFQLLGEAGPEAADALVAAMKAIAKTLPTLMAGFAEGILEFIQVIVDAAPVIAEGLGVLISHLIETLDKIIPELGELIETLIDTILEILTDSVPDIVAAGLELIIALLTGIRDNIYQITELAIEIIEEFLTSIADNIDRVIEAGLNVVLALLEGITESVDEVADAAGELVTTFIFAVAGYYQAIIDAGVEALVNFISGMTENVSQIIDAVGLLILTFISEVSSLSTDVSNAGTAALVAFLLGMTNNTVKVADAVVTLITTFITTVSNSGTRIAASGASAIINFLAGITRSLNAVITMGVIVVLAFLRGVAANALALANGAADVLIDFLNGLADAIRRKAPELRAAGGNIASAILEGLTGGLSAGAGDVIDKITGIATGGLGAAANVLGISSPSKEFMKIGAAMAEGMSVGLDKDKTVVKSSTDLAVRSMTAVTEGINRALILVEESPDFNPVVTPVIDLTEIQNGARSIAGMVESTPTLSPVVSYGQASTIAATSVPVDDSDSTPTPPGDINFNQTINAPTQLSTSEIYKQTRNQITLAKEELNVA